MNEALKKLAEFAPRESRVVDLRNFGGLAGDEAAEVLQVSAKTVRRDWRRAQDGPHGQIKVDQI